MSIAKNLSKYPLEERYLRTPITWTANTTSILAIPRDKFIQMIQLRLYVDLDNKAGGAEGIYGILDLVKMVKLISNGSDIHISVPFRQIYIENYFDLIHPNKFDHAVADSAGQVLVANVFLFFKYDPRDYMDVSAVLPAFSYSSLNLEIDWGDHTDIEAVADDITVNSAHIDVTLYEVKKIVNIPTKQKRLVWSMERHPFTAANQALTLNLKVGSNIRRIFIEALDDDCPSEDIINYLTIKQTSPITREYMFHQWESLKLYHDGLRFHLEGDLRATFQLDQGWNVILADKDMKMNSWFNTQGLKTGDVSLILDVNAPANANGFINLYYCEEQL